MPYAAEIEGFGTTLGYGSSPLAGGGSPTYITFAKIVDLEPPDRNIKTNKTGHMTTPNKQQTYQPGWEEAGKGKMVIRFAKALIATVETTLVGKLLAYTVTYADGSTHIGDAIITHRKMHTPIEGLAECEIEFETSGPWTFTAAP